MTPVITLTRRIAVANLGAVSVRAPTARLTGMCATAKIARLFLVKRRHQISGSGCRFQAICPYGESLQEFDTKGHVLVDRDDGCVLLEAHQMHFSKYEQHITRLQLNVLVPLNCDTRGIFKSQSQKCLLLWVVESLYDEQKLHQNANICMSSAFIYKQSEEDQSMNQMREH
jgi:hypothetical protein